MLTKALEQAGKFFGWLTRMSLLRAQCASIIISQCAFTLFFQSFGLARFRKSLSQRFHGCLQRVHIFSCKRIVRGLN